jgi:hypothetical protein
VTFHHEQGLWYASRQTMPSIFSATEGHQEAEQSDGL